MKYFLISLVFLAGLVLGRWSADNPKPNQLVEVSNKERTIKEEQAISKINKIEIQDPNSATLVQKKSLITDATNEEKNKQLSDLFANFLKATHQNDSEKQKYLYDRMESLAPIHEKTFQTKVMLQQENEDWEGAYQTLKDCVESVPKSIYCHQRIVNIRSSTIEDKIKYGEICLQLQKNDPLCLVDLATAYLRNGDFDEAKKLFEEALNMPTKGIGFDKRYILYQYANTLEELRLYREASKAYALSCSLNFKASCEKVSGNRLYTEQKKSLPTYR